jgi:hypothetical protein
MELYPIYMLLAGYALENAFKGVIICGTWLYDHRCIRLDDFADLRVPVKNDVQCIQIDKHGLSRLLRARAMTLEFSPDEKKVMAELDMHVLWGGRYPIPKRYELDKPFQVQPMVPFEEHYKIIDRIYDEATKELNLLISLQRAHMQKTDMV